MVNGKFRLPTWLGITIGLVVAFSIGVAINSWTQPAKPTGPTTPGPKTQVLILKAEDAAESYRQLTLTQDGRPIELDVAYHNGRLNRMFYNDGGKLTTIRSYPDAGVDSADYVAHYDSRGMLISSYERFDAGGKLTQTWSRQEDGGWTLVSLRPDGTTANTVVTWFDGSQKSIGYANDGKTVVSESVVKPEEKVVTLGTWDTVAQAQTAPAPPVVAASQPVTTQPVSTQPVSTQPATTQPVSTQPATQPVTTPPDTTPPPVAHPKYKLYMVGVRLVAWDYLNSSGDVRQHGTFEADGSVSITSYNYTGKAQFRQHWRLRGQDWNRKYYALDRVDEYFYDGHAIYRQLVLDRNEHTVRESRLYNFADGTVSQVRYYDQSGYSIAIDQFDSTGKYLRTDPPSPWYRSSEYVSDSLLAAPSSYDDGELYRLRGKPFVEPQADAPVYDPLFKEQTPTPVP